MFHYVSLFNICHFAAFVAIKGSAGKKAEEDGPLPPEHSVHFICGVDFLLLLFVWLKVSGSTMGRAAV